MLPSSPLKRWSLGIVDVDDASDQVWWVDQNLSGQIKKWQALESKSSLSFLGAP